MDRGPPTLERVPHTGNRAPQHTSSDNDNNNTSARESIFGTTVNNTSKNNNNNNNNNNNTISTTNNNNNNNNNNNRRRGGNAKLQNAMTRMFAPKQIVSGSQTLNPVASTPSTFKLPGRIMSTSNRHASKAGQSIADKLRQQRQALEKKMAELDTQLFNATSATQYFELTFAADSLARIEIHHPTTHRLVQVYHKDKLGNPEWNTRFARMEYTAKIPIEYRDYKVRGVQIKSQDSTPSEVIPHTDFGKFARMQMNSRINKRASRNSGRKSKGRHKKIKQERTTNNVIGKVQSSSNLSTESIVGQSYSLKNKSRRLNGMSQASTKNSSIGAAQSYVVCSGSYFREIFCISLYVLFFFVVIVYD